MKSPQQKAQAVVLRKEGHSYSYISKTTGVSKGTLHEWLAGMPYVPNTETERRMKGARLASAAAKRAMKQMSLERAGAEAVVEIGLLSKRDLFMLGLGLYIGEGTKTHNITRVINANPRVQRLAIRWFVECMGMSSRNFRMRLYLYPDNNVEEAVTYWSEFLDLPKSQFNSTYIDTRVGKKMAKRGKLPYGTAHLSVLSDGNKDWGVFLSRKISAWIENVLK